MAKSRNNFTPSPGVGTKPINKEDLMENGLKTPQDEMQNKLNIKKEWLIGGLILYCIFK